MPGDPGAGLDPGTGLTGAWLGAGVALGCRGCGVLESKEVPWEVGLVGGLRGAFITGEPGSCWGR